VFVFPERIEIRGAIPTQVLDISTRKQNQAAQIINSPSAIKERGKQVFEGVKPLQTNCILGIPVS
jgi:hypothetical protein